MVVRSTVSVTVLQTIRIYLELKFAGPTTINRPNTAIALLDVKGTSDEMATFWMSFGSATLIANRPSTGVTSMSVETNRTSMIVQNKTLNWLRSGRLTTVVSE